MDVALLIGGKEAPAENGAIFERRDPVTGRTTTRAAAATVVDARMAVDAARAAAAAWA